MSDNYLSNLALAISSNKFTDKLLSDGVRLPLQEGSERHKELRASLAGYLKRNLTAGERRRLCYLIAGKAQVSTVSITANTTNKAKQRVAANVDIRGSKAVKSVV